jgi:hypothetical protein
VHVVVLDLDQPAARPLDRLHAIGNVDVIGRRPPAARLGVPAVRLLGLRVVHIKAIAAIRALESAVGPQQRWGHRAGGDDEGLDHEAAEDEREDERDEDGLERFLDVGAARDRFVILGLERRLPSGGRRRRRLEWWRRGLTRWRWRLER